MAEITIKGIKGNPLNVQVIMTEVFHGVQDGETINEVVDFIPDLSKPVRAFYDCVTARRQYCPLVAVEDNVAYVSESGTMKAGVYTLTIICTGTNGKTRRYKSEPCIEIYDETDAADITVQDPYILNGVFYTSMVQSDWDEVNPASPAYILNKPDLTEYATKEDIEAIEGEIPVIPEWAQQPQKPTYTAGEVGAVPTSRTVNGKALSEDITLNAQDVGAQTPIADLAQIREGAAKGATAYQKPSTGIAKSDLTNGIQQSLDRADTALQAAALTPLQNQIDTINNKIPSDATSTNELADKNYVERLLNEKQDTINDLDAIRRGAAKGATAYQLPSNGMPKTDLAVSVQQSLDKANTAYQKPSAGIPKTDLAQEIQQRLDIPIDDEPTAGSNNLVKSGGVLENSIKDNFVKECYYEYADDSISYYINNIARDVSGDYYIQVKNTGEEAAQTWYVANTHIDNNGIITLSGGIKLIVNWDCFPRGKQLNVNIPLKNINEVELQPRIVIKGDYINNQIYNAIDTKKYKIFNWDLLLNGYANSNTASVGQKLTIVGTSSSFKHCCIPVCKGSVIFSMYFNPSSYDIAHPVIVDKELKVLSNINPANCSHITIDGTDYIYYTIDVNGYLFLSTNNFTKSVYSNTPILRESVDLPIASQYGNIFDYSVAIAMPRAELIAMVESASNGACTVKYDSNGYPSLMYRIPITSIGSLAPELGDLDTPHPAFMVNNVQKKHIYAGVFMNAEYNGVPVSWWGLESLMVSKSFAQCRTLCAAKGTGWHLETIWERSLISLLSRKYHNSDAPRGDNGYGRSAAQGFEYECVESISNLLPGSFPNGGKWINGTQPESWAHNNSRWGIFDIVGGFHEWCDLAKIDTNGKIYLCADNYYNGQESSWVDTGAYLTYDSNGGIQFNSQQLTPRTEIGQQSWRTVICNTDYDSLSESIRKQLMLALICPRLLSTDNAPLFDFDGKIWLRNNIGNCYPFMGGALEYTESGLGNIILSYNDSEAHNNMGSRLFYID